MRHLYEQNKYRKIREFNKRTSFLQICFLIFAILLLAHLFINQIVDLKHYRLKAKKQRTSKNFVVRGDIYDRNGIKLAADKLTYDIYAHPANFKKSQREMAEMLSPYLKMSVSEIEHKLSKKSAVITLKKGVEKTDASAIKQLGLRSALSMGKKNLRVYPQEDMAPHVLGYYNFDADVASGVELTAKDKLEHVEKNTPVERTPDGNIIYSVTTDPSSTSGQLKGKNITLTIDSALQHICEEELYKMIYKKQAYRGTVIVMDPKTGEILAYAVYPHYNPNNYRNASQFQIKNWTLTDVLPPGSTFKIITVSSAMALDKINPNTKILDTGKIKIGWWNIKNYDYNKKPYPGWITLQYLFEHSSNVASIKVAQLMSPEEFHGMLKKFGIGTKTGIDLPAESSGLLPKPSKWDSATHAAMGYGYGASVTPIQMISAISALANDGIRITPHIIKYSPEEAETKLTKTEVMTPEKAKAITKLLVASVDNSKAPIKLDRYKIAAKTGTSRKPNENSAGYSNKLYTSIIGYLPASDPKLLIYVLVDSPSGGGNWGSTVAAPIFKEVAQQSARILNLKPDK